jgi:nucleoside-diphosphate-sugar epimerase
MQGKTLIIGASGQIGIELTLALRKLKGTDNIIAADIRQPEAAELQEGPFEILNVLNRDELAAVVARHGITEVYQLAALLSATSEKNPARAWDLNMNGLFNILDLAKDKKVARIFWPSSIAVFGPTTPKKDTPQFTVMEPNSVYGISKLAGERWCEYYFQKHNVDVRSLRYPGLIGFRSDPGGGTTDYAVDIFHHALTSGSYECFLKEDTMLPMMMMEDAINATIAIMDAPADQIRIRGIRGSYNIAGCSFTPGELAAAIRRRIPGFTISYAPDFRQQLADSWPDSIDDSHARKDWNWRAAFDTEKLVDAMIAGITSKKKGESIVTS